MKIHGSIKLGRTTYRAGSDVAWYQIYPFFLVHMLMFGSVSFAIAYGGGERNVGMLYALGILFLTIYLMFYLAIFGRDEVKWFLINATLGMLATYGQMSWFMSEFFFIEIKVFPWYLHVVPYVFFVLYCFLVRQAFLDLFAAREDLQRRKYAEVAYVVVSAALTVLFIVLDRVD